MIGHWLLTSTGKWHAWPQGGRRTYCGRVNIEHLRTNPASKISTEVPPADGDVCAACSKKAGVIIAASNPDPTIAAWIGLLRLRLKRTRIRVAEPSIVQLATLLAEVGLPDFFEGGEVFEQVQHVLLKPSWARNRIPTLPYLKAALALLPLKSGALQQVAATVRAWRTITQRDLSIENFHADRVVAIMLQIPTPDPYIRHLNSRGLSHFAAMFHPNTLERAKKEPTLRGLFAGSNSYWDNTVSQLNIVAD